MFQCEDVGPISTIQFSSDGCGQSSGIQVSSALLSDDIETCCDMHDVCYSLCGIDKKQCELNFLSCMWYSCLSPDYDECETGIFAIAGALYAPSAGVLAYTLAQQEGCECGGNWTTQWYLELCI